MLQAIVQMDSLCQEEGGFRAWAHLQMVSKVLVVEGGDD